MNNINIKKLNLFEAVIMVDFIDLIDDCLSIDPETEIKTGNFEFGLNTYQNFKAFQKRLPSLASSLSKSVARTIKKELEAQAPKMEIYAKILKAKGIF